MSMFDDHEMRDIFILTGGLLAMFTGIAGVIALMGVLIARL